MDNFGANSGYEKFDQPRISSLINADVNPGDLNGLKAKFTNEVDIAVKKSLPTVDRSSLHPNYIYDLHGHIDDVI